ncbi:MAG: hypothetical protein AMXMBFR83_20070 [Phycisphaerae bacterium]
MKTQLNHFWWRASAVTGWLGLAGAVLGAGVTGQWDFENGNLNATVGANGYYWQKPSVPARDIEAETQFGTTTSFGIAKINGVDAKVMKFPACDRFMGYAMYPEIDANGGGQYVNQFTLIMDVYYPAESSDKWRALFQTNDCNDAGNDGDTFIRNTDSGLGISGQYAGTILPDTWHRIALAFNLVAAGAGNSTLAKYIDGVQVGATQNIVTNGGLDGRWSLYAKAHNRATLLFTDNDGDTAVGYVNSVQIRNYTMTAEEIGALGGPKAEGIESGPGVTGQWDFENGNLTATVGRPLQYFRGCGFGPCSQNLAAETQFGPASQFGVPKINGKDPKVMRVPVVQPCTGYMFPHGAAANGESLAQKVNQYSLIVDVYYKPEDYVYANTDVAWTTIYQTNPLNAEDAMLWIRMTDMSIGDDAQYHGQGLIGPGAWHRIAVVIDTTTDRMSKYLNGQLLATQGATGHDGKRALYTKASSAGEDVLLMFTDTAPDGVKVTYVNSIQVRDYAMTDDEVAALGGPTSRGIGFEDARPAPDADRNGYVNQLDLAAFIACVTAPGVPLAEADLFNCENFDVDKDLDVDQTDYARFQEFYTGFYPCAPNCFYP